MSDQVDKAGEIKQKYRESWLNIEGVVAVGVGIIEGEVGIIISVDSNQESIVKQIPEIVDGVKVVIRKTGEIKAQ